VAVVIPDFEYLRLAKIANSKEAIDTHSTISVVSCLSINACATTSFEQSRFRVPPRERSRRFELKKEIESGKIAVGVPEKKAWGLTTEDARDPRIECSEEP
jgi:hypothetical protein